MVEVTLSISWHHRQWQQYGLQLKSNAFVSLYWQVPVSIFADGLLLLAQFVCKQNPSVVPFHSHPNGFHKAFASAEVICTQ